MRDERGREICSIHKTCTVVILYFVTRGTGQTVRLTGQTLAVLEDWTDTFHLYCTVRTGQNFQMDRELIENALSLLVIVHSRFPYCRSGWTTVLYQVLAVRFLIVNSDLCVYIYIFRLRCTVFALGSRAHTRGKKIALAWGKLILDIDGPYHSWSWSSAFRLNSYIFCRLFIAFCIYVGLWVKGSK
jgi:hypothetical protein